MTNLSELHPAGVRGLCSVPGVAYVRHACGLPPIAPGLTGAGLSPRFGPHLPFDGRQRGSIQTERDRYRGGQAHYRMGSAVQDISRRLALAYERIHDGERDILMEDIKIDELNVILKEALKAVGFGTATVRAQRYIWQ